jgi:rod shape-determining protein MreC
MGDFFRRIRLPLAFAGLVLLTTFFMIGDQRAARGDRVEAPWPLSVLIEATAPIQRAIRWPFERVRGGWGEYVALMDVARENTTLRDRIAQIEEENLQLREALVESGNLERVASMRRGFEAELMPARVIGQDVSPYFRSLLLDRGRSSGVLSGMPVVSERGLVGLVTATTPSAARSMLLVDRRAAVDAVVERSRALGIVRGTGTESLEFTFLLRGADVKPGDALVTSGVGGVYPKGLRIGVVASVNAQKGALVHTARVSPAVAYAALETAFVLLTRGPSMRLLYEGEGDAVAEAPPNVASAP